MEQGPVEQRILLDCFRSQLPIPERIKNAPELRIGLQLFMTAFMDLHSCRPAGFGLSPIPWTAIHDYCERLDIIGEQREDLLYHVQALDDAYRLKHKKD